MSTTINRSEIPEADIRHAMEDEDVGIATLVATAGESDHMVRLYHVGMVRVLGTNGASVWEEEDPSAFSEALRESGLGEYAHE